MLATFLYSNDALLDEYSTQLGLNEPSLPKLVSKVSVSITGPRFEFNR
jgi:hypothetical protein